MHAHAQLHERATNSPTRHPYPGPPATNRLRNLLSLLATSPDEHACHVVHGAATGSLETIGKIIGPLIVLGASRSQALLLLTNAQAFIRMTKRLKHALLTMAKHSTSTML
eukprot:429477-Pleurochrysis_carterae.AAC.1